MDGVEFSRLIDTARIDPRPLRLEPDVQEREALARRFDLVAVDKLTAEVSLRHEGQAIVARGRLRAHIIQTCAVSGEDLPARIDEDLVLSFVPAGQPGRPDEEVELDAAACDEIEYAGTSFDLGEAIAQSLGLAIDPFATGPAAQAARKAAGIVDESATGPFAALAGLIRKD